MDDMAVVIRGTMPNWKAVGLDSLPAEVLKLDQLERSRPAELLHLDHLESIRYTLTVVLAMCRERGTLSNNRRMQPVRPFIK